MLRFVLAVTALFSAYSMPAYGNTRIAAIYPKEGINSDFECITRGVFEQARKNGVPISLDVLDNQGNILQTKLAAEKAVSLKYDAVIGTSNSEESLVAAPILGAGGVPFIVPVSSQPEIAKHGDLVVRLVSTSELIAEQFSTFVSRDLKPKRVAVLHNLSSKFSTFYANAFPAKLKKKSPGVTFSYHEIVNGFQDYKGLVKRVLDGNPDLIYMPLYTVEGGQVYMELLRLGARVQVVSQGGDFFHDGAPEESPVKLFYNGVWSSHITGPLSKDYLAIHANYCTGRKHNLRTITAFDAATLLAETVRRFPDSRGKSLVREAKRIPFHGLLGDLHFGAEGEPLRPLNVFTVKQRKPVFLTEVRE